jgi:hypothetical protein
MTSSGWGFFVLWLVKTSRAPFPKLVSARQVSSIVRLGPDSWLRGFPLLAEDRKKAGWCLWFAALAVSRSTPLPRSDDVNRRAAAKIESVSLGVTESRWGDPLACPSPAP